MAAIVVSQTNSLEIELYFYANIVFVSVNPNGFWSDKWKRSSQG